jgi:hypothetical protein
MCLRIGSEIKVRSSQMVSSRRCMVNLLNNINLDMSLDKRKQSDVRSRSSLN